MKFNQKQLIENQNVLFEHYDDVYCSKFLSTETILIVSLGVFKTINLRKSRFFINTVIHLFQICL